MLFDTRIQGDAATVATAARNHVKAGIDPIIQVKEKMEPR